MKRMAIPIGFIKMNSESPERGMTMADSQTPPIKVQKFCGEVTRLEIFQLQQQWFEDPEFDPNRPVLWDLRGAIINLEKAEVETFTKGAIRLSKKNRPRGRAAILVSTAQNYELLFKAYERTIKEGRMKVTLSEQDAVDWLTGKN